jgi:hypothetical protein
MKAGRFKLFDNIVSLAGTIVFVASTFVFLSLALLGEVTGVGGPYSGIITYMIVPVFIIFGLCLTIAGLIYGWRRKPAPPGKKLPLIDLNNSTTRRSVILLAAFVSTFFVLSAYGMYRAYEFTDSVTFCGELCHTVMRPELVTYRHSAHARVHCVECHVGPGASFYVRSKLSGMYQVYATLTNIFPRPIPGPIENLRPAQETCEQCHWPEKFFGAQQKIFEHVLNDGQNTPWLINMLLHTGGGKWKHGKGSGIHYEMHLQHKLEYVASDRQRQEIEWVRTTDVTTGESHVYVRGDASREPPEAEIRTFDCIDCHNRPSHVFVFPSRLIEEAMIDGKIPMDLLNIESIAVELLNAEYETTEEAVAAIEKGLREAYKDQPQLEGSLNKAIPVILDIYRTNAFPEMKVRWDTYPNNIDHMHWKGCMRCHDDEMANEQGTKISRDCYTCHTIIAQGSGDRAVSSVDGVEFIHPEDIGGMWQEMLCVECHGGG